MKNSSSVQRIIGYRLDMAKPRVEAKDFPVLMRLELASSILLYFPVAHEGDPQGYLNCVEDLHVRPYIKLVYTHNFPDS